ncbi:MAG: exodeoxyribonuclease VII large subunit [Xanthomonadales bacterium]|jgi:exodeoxyribonuclease VII large subunit|nr:exodeoxyribonuclease VII large subunit [Xanthomonadales bacterium]
MPAPAPDAVFTVSQLNRLARELIEDVFPLIRVEGELSNFRPSGAGHWYFSVKDSGAELRCVMFRSRAVLIRPLPVNGAKLLLRGRLTLYEARGDYQLQVEWMEDAGLGRLMQQLAALREKLKAEGLFDAARKRALPARPQRLLLLTSPTGAAIADVLSVLRRRWPLLSVTLVPIPVQGRDAGIQIAATLDECADFAAERYELLLLTRGGGSIEDLMCFNDEALCRALARFPIPTVSAVGHEIDFSLSDLVADLRAPTPSAAAESITPDQIAVLAQLAELHARLHRASIRRLTDAAQRLDRAERLLRALRPAQRLQALRQRLSSAQLGLQRALRRRLEQAQWQWDGARRRLALQSPRHALQRQRERLDALRSRLARRIALKSAHAGLGSRIAELQARLYALARRDLERRHRALQHLRGQLDALAPQRVLERGYALVIDPLSGQPLTRRAEAQTLPRLALRLADGTLYARPEPESEAG